MKIFKKIVLCTLVLALVVSCNETKTAAGPELKYYDWLTWTQAELEQSKKDITVEGSAAKVAYDKLISDADKSLELGTFSVMNKTLVGASGDKRNYLSLSTYWWPNPDTADGLPYIRRDGETNPETRGDNTDKQSLERMTGAVYNLGLAYYFTGEEKYAEKAAELVRVWFLDEATYMNPNFKHGQSVRGVSDGRVYGVLEARHFIKMIDSILLIKHAGSPAWTDEDMAGLRQWFTDFLDWCYTDDTGIGEMWGYNNHAVWMDAQMTAYLIFTGQIDRAKNELNLAMRRERSLFDAQGAQPEELARTRSYQYHSFALQAWSYLTRHGMLIEHPIQYRNLLITRSRNVREGLKFLIPFVLKEKDWIRNDIRGTEYHTAMWYLPAMRSAYLVENVRKSVRPGDPIEITAEDPEITPLTGAMETLGLPQINAAVEALFAEYQNYKEVLLYPIM